MPGSSSCFVLVPISSFPEAHNNPRTTARCVPNDLPRFWTCTTPYKFDFPKFFEYKSETIEYCELVRRPQLHQCGDYIDDGTIPRTH